MSTGRLGAGDTAIQPTIFDAKADILTATAADTPARLAVGANDTILTADSSTATGLKWAAASAPAFVGVRVFNTTNQSIATGTFTAITMNSETYDTDGFHSTVTNTSRITIPSGKAGYYLFIANQAFAANATSWRAIVLRKNNSEFVSSYTDYAGGTTGTVQTISNIINLAEGDYVELFSRQNSGGNLDIVGATNVTWLVAMKVG